MQSGGAANEWIHLYSRARQDQRHGDVSGARFRHSVIGIKVLAIAMEVCGWIGGVVLI